MSDDNSTVATPKEEHPVPTVADMKLLLHVFQYAEFKSNFNPVAEAIGVTNGNSAQKKFKKIVETYGFQLVGGQVTGPDGTPAPITPKKARTPRKRKNADVNGGDGPGDEDSNASPTKKTPRGGGRKKKDPVTPETVTEAAEDAEEAV